jgi:hypothetical protein
MFHIQRFLCIGSTKLHGIHYLYICRYGSLIVYNVYVHWDMLQQFPCSGTQLEGTQYDHVSTSKACFQVQASFLQLYDYSFECSDYLCVETVALRISCYVRVTILRLPEAVGKSSGLWSHH